MLSSSGPAFLPPPWRPSWHFFWRFCRRLDQPLIACLAPLTLVAMAAAAATVNGPPSSGGLYWQRLENGGKVQYLCRSTKDKGIQKSARCQGAKAKKP